jgi:hypothetical protein
MYRGRLVELMTPEVASVTLAMDEVVVAEEEEEEEEDGDDEPMSAGSERGDGCVSIAVAPPNASSCLRRDLVDIDTMEREELKSRIDVKRRQQARTTDSTLQEENRRTN